MPTNPDSGRILALNGGSSSIKFAIFEFGSPPVRKLAGAIERIGLAECSLNVTGQESHPLPNADFDGAVAALLDWLGSIGELDGITAIGHRIVHGGPTHFDPQIVTAELLADLRDAIPFAPNHLPTELALIDAIGMRLPEIPQVVCFDTAFHKSLAGVRRGSRSRIATTMRACAGTVSTASPSPTSWKSSRGRPGRRSPTAK